MDAEHWDSRYGQAELVWSATPNRWVEEVAAGLAPGRALDLAAGEGRNALWLAERGWRATAVDFSQVALDRGSRLATERLGAAADRFDVVCADLLDYQPQPLAYDLVLVVYLQVPAAQRTRVLRAAAGAVAPGGRLLVAAHDTDNLEHGYGGPPDATVLYSADDVIADLAGSGLEVERAGQVIREVATEEGARQALDALVVARQPQSATGGGGDLVQ
jgi:SAM-dependent methyltransferase